MEILQKKCMDIPLGFENNATKNKVCKLQKSLYGLKQSPRTWFDRFTKVLKNDGYFQCRAYHTLFVKHSTVGKLTMFIVYVDNIVLTMYHKQEMAHLKLLFSKEFEIKDLGYLRYFLKIEVVRPKEKILILQQKYVLELLSETGMIRYKLVKTPMDSNAKLEAQNDKVTVDKD